MKLADYVFRYLADQGVRHVFVLTGGGAMHLNDSLGQEHRIEYICHHHEQGCAIAAEGYSRVSGQIGVVSVTTGPGGTNALTGVLGQWLDSIPALYLSGQVRFDTTVASTGLVGLRQLGDQEADIVSIVRPITKYAVMVTDPSTIRYHLEKALYLARSGRPGPVWLDIPLNVQAAIIDEHNLAPFRQEVDLPSPAPPRVSLTRQVEQVGRLLQEASRPVILVGSGVRLSHATESFWRLADRLRIPVQVAWNAIDAFPSDHPLYAGRPSVVGQRAANFVFQNSDLLLSLACRLNVRQVGYTFPAVARAAKKIVVDIDPAELSKPTINPDLPIEADVGEFLQELSNWSDQNPSFSGPQSWLAWCQERVRRYPPVTAAQRSTKTGLINPYVLCEAVGEHLNPQDVLVSSNGTSCVIPIQVLSIQKGQRHLVNSGCAAMGFGLPAAIGACFAHGRRRVICFEGDGSIQMNIQELQTIVHHRLPIKIILFNNQGYLSIRSTQRNFFEGRLMGEGVSSGLSFPDFMRLAAAYGLRALRLSETEMMSQHLAEGLAGDDPVLLEVMVDPEQGFEPRVSSQRLPDGRMVSKPLEDMFPFLDRAEFLSNMLIPPWEG